jgi:hypothetical protein
MRRIAFFTGYALFFGLLLIGGCSAPYTPAPQMLPSHIKKVFISPIINSTTQYGLEEKLKLAITDEFTRDGRLELVNDESQANAKLVIEISRYVLEPITYDQNLVTQQYKLWILLNAYFVDKVDDVTLWKEPNLEGIQIFYNSTLPNGMTEDEARELIWDKLSRDIVKRTMEGYGSVSGASDKKVPTSTAPVAAPAQ